MQSRQQRRTGKKPAVCHRLLSHSVSVREIRQEKQLAEKNNHQEQQERAISELHDIKQAGDEHDQIIEVVQRGNLVAEQPKTEVDIVRLGQAARRGRR
jgi:hypothetical protein